mmetsp:Transcript_78352/g.212023  ORF Transcript_78352/g.212023 Transcript_78352/m.212023 type:complete len:489 (+) Transcript_78352:295-1761(+)
MPSGPAPGRSTDEKGEIGTDTPRFATHSTAREHSLRTGGLTARAQVRPRPQGSDRHARAGGAACQAVDLALASHCPTPVSAHLLLPSGLQLGQRGARAPPRARLEPGRPGSQRRAVAAPGLVRRRTAAREVQDHLGASVESPVALVGLDPLVGLVHLRDVDLERAHAKRVGAHRGLLPVVHETSVEDEIRQKASGLVEVIGRRKHRLTSAEIFAFVGEQRNTDVSLDNDVVQTHAQIAGIESLCLQNRFRQIVASLEALNHHAQALDLLWVREEVSVDGQLVQGGCRGGDWWRQRWAVKPRIRPLQMLEQLVHVPDLRRCLYTAQLAGNARVGPSLREDLEGLLRRLLPFGVEQPGAAQGPGAPLARLAVHGDYVVLGLATELARVGKKGEELLHTGRAVVLDLEARHAASYLLERLLRVGHLGASVVDPEVPTVIDLEEAGHLVQGVPHEGVEEPDGGHAHGDQVGVYVGEVEVEIVLHVHVPELIL